MANHFSIMSLGLLHVLVIMTACQKATPSSSSEPSCTCKEGKVMFKDCANKNDAEVWRKHYYTDVGLYGDCLPHVEENTRRCFRWRLADNCGPENTVKCSLRHRDFLYEPLITDSHLSQATLFSPGFYKRDSSYYNKNFCIYNISLDCPDEMVELVPSPVTTELSDAQSCRDYLSFHVESQRTPLMELCGAAVGDTSAYRTIPSTSFSAILWSDNNDVDKGRFEIVARCKIPTGQGSGAGPLNKNN